jgi:hypothetical protein
MTLGNIRANGVRTLAAGASVAAVIAAKLTHAHPQTRVQKPPERRMVG